MQDYNLSGVHDTFFIPLSARAFSSINFPKYFYDKKALEFCSLQQVKLIEEKSSEYTMMASVARYYCIDNFVRDFINSNSNGIVVNLGVGLETINYRIDNHNTMYYQVDFDNIINIRKKYLGQMSNEVFIKSNITDLYWIDKIPKNRPILLIASGVFQYLKSGDISLLLSNLKKHLSGSKLIFDATNRIGIKYANNYVKKTGNKNALMTFYISDIYKFCLQQNIKLIQHRGFFKEAKSQLKSLKLYTKICMNISDVGNMLQLFYVEL